MLILQNLIYVCIYMVPNRQIATCTAQKRNRSYHMTSMHALEVNNIIRYNCTHTHTHACSNVLYFSTSNACIPNKAHIIYAYWPLVCTIVINPD